MKHQPIDRADAAQPPEASPPAAEASNFTPAVLRPRHDGWTVERQIAFIEKLDDTGSVTAACAHVGMSRESARKLRRRPCGRAFRDAWDAATDCRYFDVEDSALERSINGVPRPIFYKGEQVGEWRYHDERLTMSLLRFRRRHRFGPEADGLPGPGISVPGCDPADEGDTPFDPEGQLHGCLDALDFAPDASDDENEGGGESGPEAGQNGG